MQFKSLTADKWWLWCFQSFCSATLKNLLRRRSCWKIAPLVQTLANSVNRIWGKCPWWCRFFPVLLIAPQILFYWAGVDSLKWILGIMAFTNLKTLDTNFTVNRTRGSNGVFQFSAPQRFFPIFGSLGENASVPKLSHARLARKVCHRSPLEH